MANNTTISIQDIKNSIIDILKEEVPHFMKMAQAKSPESVRTDLRDEAINDFITALSDLESSFSTLNAALEKVHSEYNIEDAAKDAYPFPVSIDEMYKKIIHWTATQTEVLTNRYLNS